MVWFDVMQLRSRPHQIVLPNQLLLSFMFFCLALHIHHQFNFTQNDASPEKFDQTYDVFECNKSDNSKKKWNGNHMNCMVQYSTQFRVLRTAYYIYFDCFGMFSNVIVAFRNLKYF